MQNFEIPGMPGGNIGMINQWAIKKVKRKRWQLKNPMTF
jgi:hypothetical protein